MDQVAIRKLSQSIVALRLYSICCMPPHRSLARPAAAYRYDPMQQPSSRSVQPPLRVAVGDMFKSKAAPSTIRVKAYTAPPPNGEYITTLDQDVYFGPAQEVIYRNSFVTIKVAPDYWINVGKYRILRDGKVIYTASAKQVPIHEANELQAGLRRREVA